MGLSPSATFQSLFAACLAPHLIDLALCLWQPHPLLLFPPTPPPSLPISCLLAGVLYCETPGLDSLAWPQPLLPELSSWELLASVPWCPWNPHPVPGIASGLLSVG